MDTTDPAVTAGQPAPAPTQLSPDAKAVTLLAAIEEPSIGPSTILSGAVTSTITAQRAEISAQRAEITELRAELVDEREHREALEAEVGRLRILIDRA